MQSALNTVNMGAESFQNQPEIESYWAVKCYEHAEVYLNLISSVDPRYLKLTRADDEIYKHFKEVFPSLTINVIVEEDIKSEEAKDLWRPFCKKFEKMVDDYNFGTLLRLDCTKEYSEDNSTVVPRVQFLAIEIARNRDGFNSDLRFKKKTAASP